MANEDMITPQKLIEEMTPKEAILDQSTIALKCAAYSNATILTYADFREGILEDRGIDVTDVAKDEGFENGADFLRALGLEVNDDGDLIVPTFEASSIASKFIAGKKVEDHKRVKKAEHRYQQQQYHAPMQNYQPPAAAPVVATNDAEGLPGAPVQAKPLDDVFVYDGDKDKLMPGMRVQIATGIVVLPSINVHGCDAKKTHKLRIKAGQKFRKRVREIVELDASVRASYAMIRGNKE